MSDATIVDLVLRFKAVLDSRENLLRCLCNYGVQTEGWFKAELLCFLNGEKRAGRIAEFDREVTLGIGKKKVDFSVKIQSPSGEKEALVELKHWLIGYQAGYKYNANFYFRDPTSVGIKPDVEKLRGVVGKGSFFVILSTANPGITDWSTGVDAFNTKFSPLHVESLTNPAQFPDFYHLGCLKVSKEAP